jgi:hypothetical protein
MTTSKKQYNHPTLEVIELDSIVSLQTASTSEDYGPDPGNPPGADSNGANVVEELKSADLETNSFNDTPFK